MGSLKQRLARRATTRGPSFGMFSSRARVGFASLGLCAAVALPLQLTGCGSDESSGGSGASGGTGGSAGNGGGGSGGVGGVTPEVAWPHVTCDALVDEYCRYPFPSNVHTIDDSTTPTGRRVKFDGEFLLTSFQGPVLKGDPWDKSDGFSPGVAALTYIPGATGEGLPTSADIAASLGADSPTIILDAETGERIPHWAEIDLSNKVDAHRTLMLRPAVRLKDATRYIVALRNIKTESGPAEPTAAFKALRDNTLFDGDESINQRRGLYADIFKRLGDAGIPKDDLVLAWDYTTASRENNTSWMLKMRDEALAQAGDTGPEYTITSVEPDIDTDIAFRIFGTFKAPLYVDDPAPGSHLLFGDDGLPKINETTPTYDVEFEILIPKSAESAPAKLVAYGHGLLGDKEQIESGHFRTFMNEYNYAFFAVDLKGMASDDEGHITDVLSSGQLDNLSTMFDRMHQGVLNNLLAMRMMKNAFSKDATYGKYIDPNSRYYHGISQGGIFGGVYMGLTTDVERGVLGVPGMSYNLLLNRSVDFQPFYAVMRVTYPDSRDQQVALSLLQMLWDRVEPNGYAPYIRENMLPSTPAHEVLLRAAVGDHQVSTLGAAIMARAIGAQRIDTGIRDIWNLPATDGATSGSSFFEYDFGLPAEPICNRPMSLCGDPHGKLRKLEEARQQLDLFLRTGESKNFCTNGVCKFPDQSECTGGEDQVDLCAE